MLKNYFINQEEKRLRAGCRLLLFLIAVPFTSGRTRGYGDVRLQ